MRNFKKQFRYYFWIILGLLTFGIICIPMVSEFVDLNEYAFHTSLKNNEEVTSFPQFPDEDGFNDWSLVYQDENSGLGILESSYKVTTPAVLNFSNVWYSRFLVNVETGELIKPFCLQSRPYKEFRNQDKRKKIDDLYGMNIWGRWNAKNFYPAFNFSSLNGQDSQNSNNFVLKKISPWCFAPDIVHNEEEDYIEQLFPCDYDFQNEKFIYYDKSYNLIPFGNECINSWCTISWYLPISCLILPNSLEEVGNYAFTPSHWDYNFENHSENHWNHPLFSNNPKKNRDWETSLRDYYFGIVVRLPGEKLSSKQASLNKNFILGEGAMAMCKGLQGFDFKFDGEWEQTEFAGTFYNCENLHFVCLPQHELYFTNGSTRGTFENCYQLSKIVFGVNDPHMFSPFTFSNCYRLRDFADGDSLNNSPTYDFFKVDDNMSYIPMFSFENCKSLKKVIFNKNIREFHLKCFYHCESLENNLIELKNEENISFSESCFEGARLDTNVYLPKSFDIFPSSFKSIINTREIIYSDSSSNYKSSIYNEAFSESKDLEKIDIRIGNFKYIGDMAFSGCQNLKQVYLPKTLEQKLGATLFTGCNADQLKVYVPYDYGEVQCVTTNDTGKPQLEGQGNVFVFKDNIEAKKYMNEDDPNNSWLIFREWMGWDEHEKAGSITLTNPYNTWDLDWFYLTEGSLPITATLGNHNAKPFVSFEIRNDKNSYFKITNIYGCTATISWDSNLKVGSYRFEIYAAWNDGINISSVVTTSEIVTLHIKPTNDLQRIEIQGQNEYYVRYGEGIINFYKITPYPASASKEVKWQFKQDPINDGSNDLTKITLSPDENNECIIFDIDYVNTQHETYTGILTAISTANSQIQDSMKITFHILRNPEQLTIQGQTQINSTAGSAQSSQYFVTAKNPQGSTKVNWSLEPEIPGINIDENGLLTWKFDYAVHFSFKIKVDAAYFSITSSLDVNLDIGLPAVDPIISPDFLPSNNFINGEIILNEKGHNTELTPTFTILNEKDINFDLWDFENPIWTLGPQTPDFVSLIKTSEGNTYLSFYHQNLHANEVYPLSLTCTINPKAGNPNEPVVGFLTTIIRIVPYVSSMTIQGPNNLQSLTNTAGYTNEGDYTILTDPVDADARAIWSILNDPTNGKIHVTQYTGVVSWEPLEKGTYNFTLQARLLGDQEVIANYHVTLTVSGDSPIIQPVLGDITLSGSNVDNNTINATYGTQTTITASCPILNENDLDPNIQKLWRLNNAPSGVSIDPISGVISISSNAPAVTNYSFQVIYFVGSTSQSLNATLNVNYQDPVLGHIFLSGQNVQNNVITAYYQENATISAYCLLHNYQYTDPNLHKVWSLDNAPWGVSINESTGVIHISKQTPIMSNQNMTVNCKLGSTKVSLNVNLNVIYAPINAIFIDGATNIIANAHQSGFSQYQAIINPLNADPNVTWNLIGNNEHIWIDANTGTLHWDDTLNPGQTYHLQIQANSNSLSQFPSNILNVTITVKNQLYNFPIWAYPTIIGGTMLIILIAILAAKYFKSYY